MVTLVDDNNAGPAEPIKAVVIEPRVERLDTCHHDDRFTGLGRHRAVLATPEPDHAQILAFNADV